MSFRQIVEARLQEVNWKGIANHGATKFIAKSVANAAIGVGTGLAVHKLSQNKKKDSKKKKAWKAAAIGGIEHGRPSL